ncbi:something about silencing, SAS, complex subunit 4-domain-containing protein [Aspergillus egyptiacus]|nr:something about silencing, SAS, complex subunit 4-domain-containing protein [Aspergillus egyptiacus]
MQPTPRKILLVAATTLSAVSIAASLYLSRKKQYLAARITHYSKQGQISPSTPRNVSSLPSKIFTAKYYTFYDYASVSTPRHTLPDLEPSRLLAILLRRNMCSFASSPQARLLKLTASDPETQKSFDTKHLRALEFEQGDLVCNAYRVQLRTADKVEFAFQMGVQGRLVLRIEVKEGEVVFHNETLMWRESDSKQRLPLERGLAQWVHELTAWWMLDAGVESSLRSMRPNDTSGNTIQPPPPKRPRLNPAPSRRRKSSPDLLDTTIENSPPAAATKLRRPRSRPLFALSSAHTTTSPPPGSRNTPRARDFRFHHHDSPISSTAALYLNGGRESPDPLDTISPAQPATSYKPATRPANTPTSAAYRRRRVTQRPKSESEGAIGESPKSKNPRPSRGRAPTPPADTPPRSPPATAGTADRAVVDKRRSLRSHDGGSRARSELALYFSNYEEIMSLEPPKTEFLTGNTVIKLVDDLAEPPIPSPSYSEPAADTPFGNPLLNLHGCEVVTLPDPPVQSEPPAMSSAESADEKKGQDPLSDEVYFKAHRRHERQEKQLRNIERDRAQHEKQQLDRLLDELRGHDWLRVLGVAGRSLTDAEKKLYEPKRDYFIKEINALLQKFKIWKEEEKRRKTDKDKSAASFHSDAAESSHVKEKGVKDDEEREEEASEPPPDVNDVDALAARQLLQEARSATAGKRPKGRVEPEIPPPPPEPNKPFISFYATPELRTQALSGTITEAAVLAFGRPIPDMKKRDFELPSDILTPGAIASCQRKRRRLKRASLGT